MSPALLDLYVHAVETGRFPTVDYVPFLYRSEVAKILGVEY